jgi:hypothetical protein
MVIDIFDRFLSGTDYALGYFVFIELQDAGKLNDHEIELVSITIPKFMRTRN